MKKAISGLKYAQTFIFKIKEMQTKVIMGYKLLSIKLARVLGKQTDIVLVGL